MYALESLSLVIFFFPFLPLKLYLQEHGKKYILETKNLGRFDVKIVGTEAERATQTDICMSGEILSLLYVEFFSHISNSPY